MLTVLRRGPTSIAKPLLSVSAATACSKLLRAHRPSHIVPLIATSSPPFRTFIASAPLHQQTASAVALDEEGPGAELEQEVNAQKSPSDAQSNQDVNYGPVTKFKELGDRNLVCKTVVDTLTHSMGMETMTQVQSMTINESLKGLDMYVR